MTAPALECLGPFAWGPPCGSAVLKALPEHFRVTEVLDIALSGEGEHLWLLIEKRNLNTEEVAKSLARLAGLKILDVSYAGLKDRKAVTRQWFSLQLPGRARTWAERGALPPARGTRSRLLSTARSLLFNRVLAQRVADGSWNSVLAGDCLAFTHSRSQFSADRLVENDPRLAALDIHPTGPLWGVGESAVSAATADLEQAVAAAEPQLVGWLLAAEVEQARRILRLPIGALTWHYPSPDSLVVEFTLPTGCFATAVLRELVALTDEPGGGLESEI